MRVRGGNAGRHALCADHGGIVGQPVQCGLHRWNAAAHSARKGGPPRTARRRRWRHVPRRRRLDVGCGGELAEGPCHCILLCALRHHSIQPELRFLGSSLLRMARLGEIKRRAAGSRAGQPAVYARGFRPQPLFVDLWGYQQCGADRNDCGIRVASFGVLAIGNVSVRNSSQQGLFERAANLCIGAGSVHWVRSALWVVGEILYDEGHPYEDPHSLRPPVASEAIVGPLQLEPFRWPARQQRVQSLPHLHSPPELCCSHQHLHADGLGESD
mmetsp:Transcript_111522/g.270936  ORF Transcript_111522/g.270936 Transcript_111522/m.270936 type:complete len:271 (+) Transcript_111522:189-1001(+)